MGNKGFWTIVAKIVPRYALVISHILHQSINNQNYYRILTLF